MRHCMDSKDWTDVWGLVDGDPPAQGPEALLVLQNKERRSFFVSSDEFALMKRIEARFEHDWAGNAKKGRQVTRRSGDPTTPYPALPRKSLQKCQAPYRAAFKRRRQVALLWRLILSATPSQHYSRNYASTLQMSNESSPPTQDDLRLMWCVHYPILRVPVQSAPSQQCKGPHDYPD